MNRKIFRVIIFLLIVTSGGSIIYSMIIFPNPPGERDWNYAKKAILASVKKQPSTFSFAVFGDNKNSISTFDRIRAAVNQDDVQFSVETGDLIDNMFDGESEYQTYIN